MIRNQFRSVLFVVTLFLPTFTALAYDPYEREAKAEHSSPQPEEIEYDLEKPVNRQLTMTTKPLAEKAPIDDSENLTSEVAYDADVVLLTRNTGGQH